MLGRILEGPLIRIIIYLSLFCSPLTVGNPQLGDRHPEANPREETPVKPVPGKTAAPKNEQRSIHCGLLRGIHSSKLTWKWRGAPFKTTMLYIGPSAGFHVISGE